MFIVNHFCNKIVSAQRNVNIIQIFCSAPSKRRFLERILCLCEENVKQMLDPFFQIKPWCWKTLHIYGSGGHIWPNSFWT